MSNFRHHLAISWVLVLRSAKLGSLAMLGCVLGIGSRTLANPTEPLQPVETIVAPSSQAPIQLCNQYKKKVRYILNSSPELRQTGYLAYPFYNYESTLPQGACHTIANYGTRVMLHFKDQSFWLIPDYDYSFQKRETDRQVFLYREKAQ